MDDVSDRAWPLAAIEGNAPGTRTWERFALLWLCGISLRITILAIPPVLPSIHRDLHLTETLVGALTALPILLLAAVAVPGSLLIARVGARRALAIGLTLVAVGGAARGLGMNAFVLFSMTLVMGAGIALSQPALPSLVREWLPRDVARATAVFSNGILVGEILAASFTGSVIAPIGGWPVAVAAWSVLVFFTMLGVVLRTPHEERAAHAGPVRWWPDWRSSVTWRLGLILGAASLSYFGINAFLPDFLRATHRAALITPALASLNICQLPASVVVALAPHRLVARRWPFVMAGGMTLATVMGLQLPGVGILFWVGALGFAAGLVFVLSLALSPLLAAPNDAHRLSAAMFSIAYACSFFGSLLGGAIWDHTHVPLTAFIPVLAAATVMIGLAVGLHFRHAAEGVTPAEA